MGLAGEPLLEAASRSESLSGTNVLSTVSRDKDPVAFAHRYSTPSCTSSLELHVEHLRESDLSSMLRPATTIDMMLTNLHTPMFSAEATSVAEVLPCRHSFDTKRRPGYVLALAGRYAR